MRVRAHGTRKLAAAACGLVAIGALAVTGVVAAAGTGPTNYEAVGGTFTGLRPTAVGLPQIGAHGTVGATEIAGPLITYHDSGAYANDLDSVVRSAWSYLDERLNAPSTRQTQKVCKDKFHATKKRTKRGAKLYTRVRRCKKVTTGIDVQPPQGKPAIVLDIDETSLSNYSFLVALGFSSVGLVPAAATGTSPAIGPTLALFKHAQERGVATFFVTGRPDLVSGPTQSNLHSVGYNDWTGLFFKPSGTTTIGYKSGTRAQIESQGYDILVNIGDQESDLDGGHADRAFKLPNPFYFIGDE